MCMGISGFACVDLSFESLCVSRLCLCVDKAYIQGLTEGSSCYMLTTPPCTHMHILTSLSSSHYINKLSLFRKRPPPLSRASAWESRGGKSGGWREGQADRALGLILSSEVLCDP